MSASPSPSSFIPSGESPDLPDLPAIPPIPPTSQAPERRFLAEYRALWRIPAIRWLALGNGLSNMIFFSTVIVRFEQSRGLDFTEMFLLESLISLFAWLFDIPTGIWADQFGRKRLLLAGRALNALSLVVMALAQGFLPFAFGSLLFGVGLACVSGCESALVHESLPDETSQTTAIRPSGAAAFALLGTAQSGGFFVGLIIGSVVGAVEPTIAVVASIAPAALAILATGWLPTDAPPRQTPVASASAHDANATSLRQPTQGASSASAWRLLQSAWRTVRTQPRLVGLSLTQTGGFVLVNAIFWYNQPLFARAGLPIVWYGSLTALAVGCGMLTPLALPWARRRVGARWALAVALLAPASAYGALAFAQESPVVVALVALVVGGAAWRDPLIQDELTRSAPAEARATALSALSFLGTLAGVALNPLIGALGDVNLAAVGLGIGGVLLALGLCAPWLLAHRRA